MSMVIALIGQLVGFTRLVEVLFEYNAASTQKVCYTRRKIEGGVDALREFAQIKLCETQWPI